MPMHLSLTKDEGIDRQTLSLLVEKTLEYYQNLEKVLLIPPDLTRGHSRAGVLTKLFYQALKDRCAVDILPALGTHMPMTEGELRAFFGDIPKERFIVHDWRNDVVSLGQVPEAFIEEVSEGKLHDAIDVQVNKRLLKGQYDLMISLGQVVPHEVVGMANYSKNIFVGCGGSNIINSTHFLGAVYGMERMMGRDDTPVRRVFDYAQTHYGHALNPLLYVLTVVGPHQGQNVLQGIFVGEDRKPFEQAVALSQKKNLDLLERPIQKAVVYLDPTEFRSTWLGNKAIYRTRMAIVDGGELVILAPGVKMFGEDKGIDALIRKYGYWGTPKTLEAVRQNDDLAANLSAAAHLIHGSSEGRFKITYAVSQLTEEEIRGVGFDYMPLEEALLKYPVTDLPMGYHTLPDGEEIFYIPNPALGLWALKEKF